MKTIVAGMFFLAVLFNFNTPKRNFSTVKATYTEFKADSGYIKKDEAIRLLEQANYDLGYKPEDRDTLVLDLPDIKVTDTIGKYYRMDNGNYLW